MTKSKPHFTSLASGFVLCAAVVACAAPRARSSAESANEGPATSSSPPAPEAALKAQDEKPSHDAKEAGSAPPTPSEQDALADEEQPQKLGQKSGSTLADDLHLSVSALDSALGETALSCDTALPHRDAICSIAARLCTKKDALGDARSCSAATESCTQAKARFKTKCGG